MKESQEIKNQLAQKPQGQGQSGQPTQGQNPGQQGQGQLPKKSTSKKIRETAFVVADTTISILKLIEEIDDPYGASKAATVVRILLETVVLARANAKQLSWLAQRVAAVTPILQRISEAPKSKLNVNAAMSLFTTVVTACNGQATKYAQKNFALKLIQTGTNKEKFAELNIKLTDAISALTLALGAEATVLLEQQGTKSLLTETNEQVLKEIQEEDKQDIINNKADILNEVKATLEQEQNSKYDKLKNQKQDTILSEQERAQVLGSQMQSAIATLAENLNFNSIEKNKFFKAEYTTLQQEKRFQEINIDPGQPKPPIDRRLLIPLHEINVQQKIATGDFGLIYKGTWCEVPVVVKKVCGPMSKKEDQEQFIREVNIMAQLRNPHITQLYGACMEPESCLVMEYMENGSLDKLLERKTLSYEEQRNLAMDIAKGLLYLHSRDVIHRDLKTANILINAQGQAKLTDFGLSKTADQKVKTIAERSEAIQWMAPETLGQDVFSVETDIYSYGMVLWSICTGKKPFANFSEIEITQKILKGECEKLDTDMPSELQSLIHKCWSKSPLDRPSLLDILEVLKSMNDKKELSAAELCDQGQAYEKNKQFDKAESSYRLAADKGFFRAQTNLGTLYLNGTGVKQDKKEAYYWLLQSAKQNHARAQYNVARMLEKGDGVEKSLPEAFYWYQEASKQGIAEATKKVQELQKLPMGNNINNGFQRK